MAFAGVRAKIARDLGPHDGNVGRRERIAADVRLGVCRSAAVPVHAARERCTEQGGVSLSVPSTSAGGSLSRKRIYMSVPHMGQLEQRYVAEAFETNWLS